MQINYGIKTGCNEAFIITSQTRDKILSNCMTEEERQRTEAIIRPILRGRDINRYGYQWANLWLIHIPWHFPYQFDESIQGASQTAEEAFTIQYPAVYNHMLQYKEDLSQRNKSETGIRYEWYAMQRWGAQYWEDFSKPKIIWKRVGSIIRFSYDEKGLLGLDSTCFATGSHIPYLCCILNSSMGHYLLKNAPRTGTGDLLISVQAVEPIKIPSAPEDENIFESFVKELSINHSNEMEVKMDNIIFDLYGLNQDEREFISNNFQE